MFAIEKRDDSDVDRFDVHIRLQGLTKMDPTE